MNASVQHRVQTIAAVMLVIMPLAVRAAMAHEESLPSARPVSPVTPDAPPELSGFPSTKKNPSAPCTCGDAKGMSGWCERHGIGYVGSVRIRSWLLYEMMDAHGHTLDFSNLQCPECRKAMTTDGYCEEHKIGFVGKKAYFSRLTFELARAEKRDLLKITCPVCWRSAGDHGWCETHQVGMVGDQAILGRDRWDHVTKAIGILEIAEKTSERCEHCAMAIVTDSRCPFHRITYKDGHPVSGPEAPATASGR